MIPFKEAHISQLPALLLLRKLEYPISPERNIESVLTSKQKLDSHDA